ncbi:membrane protein [Apiospora kogelbergensis]|uniref:Membrane protein n=1 Tax=Apiospora kogelbergensis TaxID=1337665 RepID=A0AAW0QW77_9PEZI
MVPERSRLSHSNFDVTSRKPSSTARPQHLSPLPAFDIPSFDLPDFDFDPNFSIPAPDRTASTDAKHTSLPVPEPDKMGRARGKSLLTRRQSWMPGSKSTSDLDLSKEPEKEPSTASHSPPEVQHAEQKVADKSRSMSGSFASLAKRSTSWIATSRSPSPSPRKEARDYVSHKPQGHNPSRDPSPNNEAATRSPKYLRKRAISSMDKETNKSTDSLGKLGNYLSKMKQRPQSLLVRGVTINDGDSTTSSIASSATNTHPSNPASEHSNTTVPDEVQRPHTTQPRDPLWSAFKALDAEHGKFQAKSVHMKVSAVRNTLLPFLRKYALHPSNNTLHFEELEPRAIILNKWWVGLLELLDGKANQSVAGVDRPIVLEVTTILMMRPEWRQCIPQFSPLAHRNPRESVGRKEHAHSNGSGNRSRSSTADSEFLAESAEHNVRTMFVTNLVVQMGIVVDKLSQRHAPLSLVNFAGRACAYAFFLPLGWPRSSCGCGLLPPICSAALPTSSACPDAAKGKVMI